MKTRRWLTIAGFVLSLGLAVVYGFLPRPLLVDTAVVGRAPLQVSIEAEGVTRVKERYVISAPVAGVARRIDLDVGDRVSAGQVLAWLAPLHSAVLDPRSRALAQARLAAAEAGLRVAQANRQAAAAAADYAAAELERLRRLRRRGVVSAEALDQADSAALRSAAEHSAAESAVEVARYELEAARSALRYSAARAAAASEPVEQVTLTAPVDGRVLKIHQRSEYVVEPGRPLLEVGDPAQLEVAIDLLSADAVRVSQGDPVWFRRWGGEGALAGRVRVVEPAGFTEVSALGVEEQRVWVIADFSAEGDRWRRLGDGYRVDAEVVLWQGDDVLQVPTSALVRHGDGWAVFRVDGGRARLTPVRLGRRSGLAAEVVSGLEAGDTLVDYPDDAVADGVRVRRR